MSKKLNWLDKFAEDQAKKQVMKKEASSKKVANQIIVSPEDVPGAQNGAEIEFNGEQFKVVDANFQDEIGAGVVLEKSAGSYDGLAGNPMDVSMGAPAAGMTGGNGAQEYHYTKLETQQVYDNDQDAQWGQSSAPATAQEIAGEDSVDRTNIPGKFTRSPGLNTTQDGASGIAPVDPNAQVIGYPPVGGAAPTAIPGAAPVGAPVDSGLGSAPVAPTAPVAEPALDAPVAPAAEEVSVEDETTEEVPAEEVATEDEGEEKEENKILSRVKKSMPVKKAKTTRTAMNATIITLASDVAKAIVAETEEVLEDAEETVRKLVPSHLVAQALKLLEDELEEEGVEASFDKTVSKTKTAGADEDCCDEEDVKEVVKKIAEAVTDEMEGMLADADETMDEERETLADGEEAADQFELEAKLKAMVERKLHAKGIYTRFARTAKRAPKKTIAQKIRDARKKR